MLRPGNAVLGRLIASQATFLATAVLLLTEHLGTQLAEALFALWLLDGGLIAIDAIVARQQPASRVKALAPMVALQITPLLAVLWLPVSTWLILLLVPITAVAGGLRLGWPGLVAALLAAVPAAAIAVPVLHSASTSLSAAALLVMFLGPVYQTRAIWQLKLKESALQLEHARRSRFLATMSHELRTPLNSISQTVGLLTAERLSARQHHLLQVIEVATASLVNTVNDVLDLSRISEDKLVLNPQPLNIRALVVDVRKILLSQADSKRLTLVVDVRDDVPPALVADPMRLRQILLNLASNAIRFTERGSVSIGLRPGLADGTLRITVADTGPGIPEAEREKVLEPFYQVSAGASRAHGGSGLGLGIVAAVVRAMHGTIILDDNPGGGLLVTVEVETPTASLPEVDAMAAPTSLLHQFERHRSLVPTRRILIVEDNHLNAESLRATLELAGHQVEHVEGGAEAIQVLRSEPFDLTLLDLNMPEVDGWKVLEELGRAPGLAALCPIVMCSADQTVEARQASLALGARDFIAKPVDIPQLLALVANAANDAPSLPVPDPAHPASTNERLARVLDGADEVEAMRALLDEQRFADYASVVLETYGTQRQELCDAAAREDVRAVKSILHNLKSQAGSHGLRELRSATEALERRVQDSVPEAELAVVLARMDDGLATLHKRLAGEQG